MESNIQKYTEVFTIEYPQAEEFIRTQLTKCFWTADEINVQKDVQDVLVNCTNAEKHGLYTVLKLFTLYELRAGSDYWTGRFMNDFKRHELASMGSAFGMMELCVHKPFYNKINELLNATKPSFYTDYVYNPVLASRMQFIDDIINSDDVLVSVAGFSMVEGAILYSSFAFLKHFQSLGKNKLVNIVRGINFSVRDENLHALAGAWVFNTLVKETLLTEEQKQIILSCASTIYEHEKEIIDMIFSEGDIEGIDKEDMKAFVKERLNICLSNLNLPPLYPDANSNISKWFYKGINNYQMNDFFTGGGREYSRDWDETKFIW